MIRKVAEETGIPLIDLESVFEPMCPDFLCPQWLYEDQHPNEARYRIVAETIVSRLPEQLR